MRVVPSQIGYTLGIVADSVATTDVVQNSATFDGRPWTTVIFALVNEGANSATCYVEWTVDGSIWAQATVEQAVFAGGGYRVDVSVSALYLLRAAFRSTNAGLPTTISAYFTGKRS